jgi:uncharacterized protein YcbK (DUF882 family)
MSSVKTLQSTVQSSDDRNYDNLHTLDETIRDLKIRVSHDPDPFLVELLSKLKVIHRNQQAFLEQKAVRTRRRIHGGFKGVGQS